MQAGPWSSAEKKTKPNLVWYHKKLTEKLYELKMVLPTLSFFAFQHFNSSILLQISKKYLAEMWQKSVSEQLCDILLLLQLFFIWTSCQKPICKPAPPCPGHAHKKMVSVPKLSPWNRRQGDTNWVLMGQRQKRCAQKGIPRKSCSRMVDRHRQGLGSAWEMAGLDDFTGLFQPKWFPVIPRPFGKSQRRNVGMFALEFGNI